MRQPLNGSSIRRHAGWCGILLLALASCFGSIGDPNALLNPINSVTVYAGSQFEFAEVDDTTIIEAWGYYNGEGIGTQLVKTALWTPSDPAMLQMVRTINGSNGSYAVLRGRKPGLVTLSVTLNGVTGSDTLRVLPKIKALQLKSTRTTLAVGDTVEIWLRAEDLNGDSIPTFRPLIIATFFGAYAFPLGFIGPWPRQRFIGKDTGTVRFYTRVANDSTDMSIRVSPAP